MLTTAQPKSETPRRKEFQDSLQILTGVTSWHLRSSVVMFALLAGAIGFLLFRTSEPSLPVLGLLALACVVSGVTLHRQRGGLKLLREGLIEHMNSIIKQRAKTEQFYGMATQDALTGLFNRRFGETRLQQEIARAEKSGEPLILIAADFDKFKHINDQYGHAAGDLALKEFSRRLQRAVRACDVPIRVGGDEFLVIFPECVLEKIPEIMSRMETLSFPFEGKKIPFAFSYGAAQYQPNDTPETILKRADERLYAKKAKRKAARQEEARAVVAEAGFRRSERVPFEMPVQVYIAREKEEPMLEEAKTLSVNAHGALLALSTPVVMGQTLRLVNPRTQKEMECRVCRFGELHEGDTKEVGVEFATVAPTFWDVPSVPADWDTASPQPSATTGASVSHLSDDVGKAMRSSSPAQWNPPWAPRQEGSAPLSAEALSALSDDMERVMEGSRPLGPSPEVSGTNEGTASRGSSLTDAQSVVWGDNEMVKDVSLLAGLDPAWVPKPEDHAPKVTFTEKGQEIINEALQKLETPSEDAALAAKTAQARTTKWLVVGLALPVAVLTVWLAMPRRFSGSAASGRAASTARSGQPNQEGAGMISSQPSGSTASGLSPSGLSTGEADQISSSQDATLLGTHPCAAAEAGAPGVSMQMTRIMPRVAGVRLATKEDFDPEAVSWLRSNGQDVSSQIAGDFTGSGESRGYLWVGNNKLWHVVLLTNDQKRCDVSLPSVAIAAWVSKEAIRRIQWDGAAPEPSGDALLIVRSVKDPASGVIFSLRGNDIVGSRPADYRQVPLGERSVANTDSQ